MSEMDGRELFELGEKYRKNSQFEEAYQCYLKSQELGCADAKAGLSVLYARGKYVEKDKGMAFKLASEAADEGSLHGMYWLGRCYMYEIGTEEDYAKALSYLLTPADNGFAYAKYLIGKIYYWGDTKVKQDREKAFGNFKSIEHEVTESYYYLGLCYENGYGTHINKDEAMRYYKLAYESGEEKRAFNIAWLLEDENPVKNAREYIEWYRKGVDAGDKYSMYNLGLIYYNGDVIEQDYHRALELFECAASKGLSEAYAKCAQCYYVGDGTEVDYTKAKEYALKAAMDEVSLGFEILGDMYFYGEGCETDYVKAAEYYNSALRKKDSKSVYAKLAMMYKNGYGVEKNEKRAISLMEEGAEVGNSIALGYLGKAYLFGEGVEEDYGKAVFYLRKCCEDITKREDFIALLGFAYYRNGDYDNAFKCLNTAIEKYDSAIAYHVLGLYYFEGKAVEKTVENYEKGRAYFVEAAKRGMDTAQEMIDLYDNVYENVMKNLPEGS